MITGIITLLIYVVLLAIVFYLVIWVLGVVGVALPPKVVQLIWVAFALIVVLMLVQMLLGGGLPHLGRIGSSLSACMGYGCLA